MKAAVVAEVVFVLNGDLSDFQEFIFQTQLDLIRSSQLLGSSGLHLGQYPFFATLEKLYRFNHCIETPWGSPRAQSVKLGLHL